LDGFGNFIWAKAVGGIGTDESETVALDPSGNVYATGRFSFTSDFDPGPGTFNFTASNDDMFVLKLSANGNFAWAKQISGPEYEVGRNIATDAAGNVYTTGIFQNVTDFDPGPGVFNLTANGFNNIFISKLNTDGDFIWAMRFGGGTSEDRGNAISLNPAGNLYVTGNFAEQIDFDPGPGTAILLNSSTAEFMLKFGPGSVLPLTLLNFSATAAANGTLLKWQTSQEINTKHFEVEWSNDGQQYNKINTVAAAGNSTQTIYYTYTHDQPLAGINYYRLKMIDKDNQYKYSPIVTITINDHQAAVSVFPNPVTDVLQIKIAAEKNEKLTLKLLNAEGKVVASKIFTLVKGSNRLSWNLPNLATGNYFISSTSKQFETIKITRH
ncbi:MAG: SBBP repeat-containing protein, partial [Ferruginibacter sp.]